MEVSRVLFYHYYFLKIFLVFWGEEVFPLKVYLKLASLQDGLVSQPDLVWDCLCCFQSWNLTLLTLLGVAYSCLLILALGLVRVWDLWDYMVYSIWWSLVYLLVLISRVSVIG